MQNNRYFFDKRVIKKALIKYGIMFLIGLPILVVMNVYVLSGLSFWGVTMIDVAILLGVVLIGLLVYNEIEKAKLRKIEQEEQRRKELLRAKHKAQKQAKKNKNQTKERHDVSQVEIVVPDKEE